MFTKVSAFDEPKLCFCNSTDTKQLDVPNGSFLIEIDTSKRYFFDAEFKTWEEWNPS